MKRKRSIKSWSNNVGYYIEAIGEGGEEEIHFYHVDDGTAMSKEVTREELIAMGAKPADVAYSLAHVSKKS